MATTPTLPPSRITAGTTVLWNRTPGGEHADRTPAAGWALTVRLQGQVTKVLTAITGSLSYFPVVLSATDTAPLPPGDVRILEVLSKGSEVYVCAESTARIVALANSGEDARGWAEKTLAAIESILSGRVSADLESYSIGGRSITKIPVRELRELRVSLQFEVARKRKNGALTGVGVQFTSSGVPVPGLYVGGSPVVGR